jgi:hypothetical protein
MTRRLLVPAGLLAVVAVSALGYATRLNGKPVAGPSLTEAEFATLMKTVPPVPGEDPFATIPWQTSLWAARMKAAKEGKPILLWEMDGHPLGCG